ncbi:phage replisome organizer N-terminal domain-containing protein [Paraclostridium ghonii]|uniref:phage replisome organizer N-terminal domain-containing protein n=1 Tax=Paraclostridium ghonii TaxID=29358 RepID=UPI00202CFD1A|nr:phage replisome organizer N-terminal domain-containing protein [Paeniclostridium ghonii]MCM0167050.1 phage replisome organizer N-terminal domain-containing protein [Paeniclostridium ghonii]
MTKKYYWLKLKEDFFEEDAISWIEEQENGKDYCLFYLKLCLKSLKTNGLLIRNVGSMLVPYDIKTLARVTNTEPDTVRVAMELFKRIGLVQILENGEIYIAQLQNMVGSETSKAQLMRNKRQKEKKVIESGNNVTSMLPGSYLNEENCYTEIEKEIEKEIDIEQQHIEKVVADNEIERSLVILELKKAYNHLLDKDIKKIADTLSAKREGYDLDYLKEKIELSKKQSNIRNLVGFLIKAINENFSNESITSFDKNNSDKPLNPKVHNFSGSDGYSKYSEEELERIILENQKHKFQ